MTNEEIRIRFGHLLEESQEPKADEEDWLAGVPCNPDAPEECESCQ